jgi:benzoyl-CoA-dihydrodiol lyase
VAREGEGDVHRATYSSVVLEIDRKARVARLLVRAPEGAPATTSEELRAQGDQHWHLRAFRELDDALLELRFNHPEIGLVLVRTEGDAEAVLAHDEALVKLAKSDWLAHEIVLQVKRVLKRMDLTAKSFFAIVAPGSAFAGVLFELCLAADRTYMLDGELEGEGAPQGVAELSLSSLNFAGLPMSNGLTRLETRFLATPPRV